MSLPNSYIRLRHDLPKLIFLSSLFIISTAYIGYSSYQSLNKDLRSKEFDLADLFSRNAIIMTDDDKTDFEKRLEIKKAADINPFLFYIDWFPYQFFDKTQIFGHFLENYRNSISNKRGRLDNKDFLQKDGYQYSSYEDKNAEYTYRAQLRKFHSFLISAALTLAYMILFGMLGEHVINGLIKLPVAIYNLFD